MGARVLPDAVRRQVASNVFVLECQVQRILRSADEVGEAQVTEVCVARGDHQRDVRFGQRQPSAATGRASCLAIACSLARGAISGAAAAAAWSISGRFLLTSPREHCFERQPWHQDPLANFTVGSSRPTSLRRRRGYGRSEEVPKLRRSYRPIAVAQFRHVPSLLSVDTRSRAIPRVTCPVVLFTCS